MKKFIVLLSTTVLLMTGCGIIKLSDNDIEKNIKTLMSEKVNLHNVHYDGYRYYLPKGISFITKDDFNDYVKYYLQLSFLDTLEEPSVVRSNHTSLTTYEKTIKYAITLNSEGLTNKNFKEKIKKIRAQ